MRIDDRRPWSLNMNARASNSPTPRLTPRVLERPEPWGFVYVDYDAEA